MFHSKRKFKPLSQEDQEKISRILGSEGTPLGDKDPLQMYLEMKEKHTKENKDEKCN